MILPILSLLSVFFAVVVFAGDADERDTLEDPLKIATAFTTTWTIPSTLMLGQSTTLALNITSIPPGQDLSTLRLLLVQTDATGSPVDTSNSWLILSTELQCRPGPSCSLEQALDLVASSLTEVADLQNFFFCVAEQGSVCESGSYSPFFAITSSSPANVPTGTAAQSSPSVEGPLIVTATSTILSLSGTTSPATTGLASSASPSVTTITSGSSILTSTFTSTPTSITGSSSSTSSSTTISKSPSSTVSQLPSATASYSSSATTAVGKPHNSHGLSAGAIAGIVLGSIIAAILLIIGAFVIIRRRKLKQQMQPEHMMLASNHSRAGSRDMLAEKDISDSGAVETGRGSIMGSETVYDERPRTGSPIRMHSTRLPLSSPETMSPASRVESYEEPYRDAPAVYGDARHSPQIFRNSQHFLGEEDMSPEEIARLEEEERRIDDAIAEAERSRR